MMTIAGGKLNVIESHGSTIVNGDALECECGHRTFIKGTTIISMSMNSPAEQWELICMQCSRASNEPTWWIREAQQRV